MAGKTRRTEDWLALGLLVILGLLLAAKIIFSLNIMWQIFNYPFQVDESEGMIVAETEMMLHGKDIYAPPTLSIFVSAPYTPVYYLLNLPFLAFLSNSFKPGRLLSLAATIGIAVLIYQLAAVYTTRRKGRPDRIAGITGSLTWASLGLVAFWGGAVKPDITALLFSLLGVWGISRYKPEELKTGQGFLKSIKQERWIYLAAIFLALAVLTKQTAFAAPVAVFAYLLLKKPRAAIKFLGTYLVLGFGPMVLMNLFSQGGFWWHIVTVHELPWSSYNYWKFMAAFLQNYQIYLGVAVLLVLFYLADMLPRLFGKGNPFNKLAAEPGTLILGYTLAALVMTVSVGTYGGNHNHLLEFSAAACLCLGLTISRLREWWQGKNWYRWSYPLVLVLLAGQVLGMFVAEARIKPENFPVLGSIAPAEAGLEFLHNQFYEPDWLGLQYRAPQPDQTEGYGRVAQFITNDRGPLLYSDDVSLAMASGKPVFTTDTFTQTHATHFGRWDESQLVQMIKDKKFSVIVLRESIQKRLKEGRPLQDIYVSPAIAQAILDSYDLTCPDRATIYEPKDKPKALRCGT